MSPVHSWQNPIYTHFLTQPLVKLVQWDNMDRLWMMTLPVATIAALAGTTNKLDNPRVKIAAPASTTIKSDNLQNPLDAKIAALADTATKPPVFPIPCVKVVPLASTTINLARAVAQIAPMVNTPRNLPPRPSRNATRVSRAVL